MSKNQKSKQAPASALTAITRDSIAQSIKQNLPKREAV